MLIQVTDARVRSTTYVVVSHKAAASTAADSFGGTYSSPAKRELIASRQTVGNDTKQLTSLPASSPVCAYSSWTTARLVYCLLLFLCSMTLVGTPIRPEVLAPWPPSILDAWSGLACRTRSGYDTPLSVWALVVLAV